MGGRMVDRLMTKGHNVIGHNRTKSAFRALPCLDRSCPVPTGCHHGFPPGSRSNHRALVALPLVTGPAPDPVEPVDPWVALLPPLDPTTMGWTERAWYLGDHKAQLFDTAGNAGPTVWCDGRIVGGWRQRDDGSVELQLLEKVGRAHTRALKERADELTQWFGGRRVMMRFPSPLSKASR